MIKQTITYEDYNGNEVTEDFYFNLNKLEIIEMEIEREGGLQKYIEELTQTTAGPDAYHLFKDIVLASYGELSEDGKRFIKKDPVSGAPLRDVFETSPAMAELIFTFLKEAGTAVTFVKGILPAKILAEAEKEGLEMKAAKAEKTPELTPVAPVLEDPKPLKKWNEYSKAELLAMSKEEFERVVPTDPNKMNKAQLAIAYQRKSKGDN